MATSALLHMSLWPPVFDRALSVPKEQRLAWIAVAQLCTAAYVLYVVKRARAGLPRFLLALPALVVLGLAPFLFHHRYETLYRTSILFTSAWLGTHKVAAMCLNRGSLAGPWNFIQFLVLLYLPIFPSAGGSASQAPKGRLYDVSGGPLQLMAQAVAKIGVLALVAFGTAMVDMPDIPKYFCYAFGLVGFLGLLMDGPASVATSLIGIKIIPTFDQPWLSTSMADFWGRRWNITTSSVLRVLYYDPLVEGRWVKPADEPSTQNGRSIVSEAVTPSPSSGALTAQDKLSRPDSPKEPSADDSDRPATHAASPPKTAPVKASSTQGSDTSSRPRPPRWRRVCGTCATFLASGLAHEYIINALVVPKPDGSRPWLGKWTLYFTLQAPLLLLELKLKQMYRAANLRPPPVWLSRVATLSFMIWVGKALFFAPVDKDSDLASTVVKQVTEGFIWLVEVLRPVLTSLVLPLLPTGFSSGPASGVNFDKSEL